MIIEYTDSASHPTVVAWLSLSEEFVHVAGGAWRMPGGWAHWAWWGPIHHGPSPLRWARLYWLAGNGRRHGGHTTIGRVAVMSRCNVLALLTVQ